jgi:hypothetical protein
VIQLLEPAKDTSSYPGGWEPWTTLDVGRPSPPSGTAFGSLAGLHMPNIEWLVAIVKGASGGGYISIYRSKRAKDPVRPFGGCIPLLACALFCLHIEWRFGNGSEVTRTLLLTHATARHTLSKQNSVCARVPVRPV